MAGNFRAYLAELIGTFAIVLAASGSICLQQLTGQVSWVGTALAQGMMFAAMVAIYGRVSGGHFNPAITLSRLASRKMEFGKALFYIISQVVGAVLASWTLMRALHHRPDIFIAPTFLGACQLQAVGFKAATLLEALGTFFLVSASMVERREGDGPDPLAMGLVLAAGVLSIGPLTGGALNPARAFGPSLMSGYWKHWHVYWLGPAAGALAAAWLHGTLFADKKR